MKIIIAGGGTGGHLFPGIALAEALPRSETSLTHNARHPAQILFLCTERPFDAQQLSRYGFNYHILPSPRFSLSPNFIFRLIKSIRLSYRLITRFKPDYVVGLGGYGSLAPLIVARILNIPIALLEQNLLPGKVTRWLSAWAKIVACQWRGSTKYLSNPLRARIIGSPIRTEIKKVKRSVACQKLGIDSSKKTLAIIGGSQGAQAINRFILDNLELLKSYSDRLAIIHLSGERDYPALKNGYSNKELSYYLNEFSEEMSDIYSAADLVIARAGGITIAELTVLGIPAVLIPFPYAAENHQYYNALEFEKCGAGVLIEQKDLSTDKLKHIIEEILFKPSVLSKMAQASQHLSHPGAAENIITLL